MGERKEGVGVANEEMSKMTKTKKRIVEGVVRGMMVRRHANTETEEQK